MLWRQELPGRRSRRKNKDADDKAAVEASQRQWQENIRLKELAELKRLKEKYEGTSKEGDAE